MALNLDFTLEPNNAFSAEDIGGFATAIGKNTEGTTIFDRDIANGTTDIIILEDENYIVNVNGVEEQNFDLPVYGNSTIDIYI